MLSADYITPDWRRQALVLGCVPYSEQHSSSNIADWLTKQLNDWNLTAVTELIVSDTASNQMGIFNLELAPHLPRHLKPNDKICSWWFVVTSLPHQVQQMWRGCSVMGALWPLITAPALPLKSWIKSFSSEKTP